MKTLESWNLNADNWIGVIDQQKIASRSITNAAILNTISEYQPTRLCDIGCGEGWLTRACNENGIEAIGYDGTEKLVIHARQKGGIYYHLTYEQMIEDEQSLSENRYEAAVFNFSLYDEKGVFDLLQTVAKQLIDRQLLFIQTLHPFALSKSEKGYTDQWIMDSWKGLPDGFAYPHKWYARTLQSWVDLFASLSFKIIKIQEPTNANRELASIIFVLSPDHIDNTELF